MLRNYLWIFVISMVPLVELRGAIPVSQLLSLPLVPSYLICIAGNLLPVPLIWLFARSFLTWGAGTALVGAPCRFCLERGTRAGERLQQKAGRGVFVALFLFVGVPLPGTGAWTGTLAASLLGLDGKKTVAAVCAGVLMAGVLMMTAALLVKAGVLGAADAVTAAGNAAGG